MVRVHVLDPVSGSYMRNLAVPGLPLDPLSQAYVSKPKRVIRVAWINMGGGIWASVELSFPNSLIVSNTTRILVPLF